MSWFRSSNAVEKADNDDADFAYFGDRVGEAEIEIVSAAETGTAPPLVDLKRGTDRDAGPMRLSDRIAAIEPTKNPAIQEPTEPIAVAIPVHFRVSNSMSLSQLLLPPPSMSANAATTEYVITALPDGAIPEVDAPPLANPTNTINEPAVETSILPITADDRASLLTEARLAALLREQRELLDDLAQMSKRLTSVGSLNLDAADHTLRTLAGDSGPKPPLAVAGPSVDMIKALAAAVASETAARSATSPLRLHESDAPYSPAQPSPAVSVPKRSLGFDARRAEPPTRNLVHTPDQLGLDDLLDDERPPMIIEKAYAMLPFSEQSLPPARTPGLLAGFALSGVAGLVLFMALRVP